MQQQTFWAENDPQDTFFFERDLFRQGYRLVAGVDEAGRGPLAGPVVAACVVLPEGCEYTRFQDSKVLTPEQRRELFDELRQIGAAIGIGIGTVAEIERHNILQASLRAMRKAVLRLPVSPDILLVDGTGSVPLSLPQQSLIKGDRRSASIGAASIIAKVTRDELMEKYHHRFPRYNFRQHKGYPTAEHRMLLSRHGPCAIHRRGFKGVREFFSGPQNSCE